MKCVHWENFGGWNHHTNRDAFMLRTSIESVRLVKCGLKWKVWSKVVMTSQKLNL